VKIRLVTSLREFDALAPVWREVTRESGQTSPFVSHDWFACCWRTAGAHRRREVWLMEDSAGPVGLIPLLRLKGRVRGAPVRMVRVLDASDAPFTDFPVARAVDEMVGLFLATLAQQRDWDVLVFPKVPAHSVTFKALEAALPGFFPWRLAAVHSSPHLTISGTWDEYLRQRPADVRKACQDADARIRLEGEVMVEEHREVDPEGPVFAEMMELFCHSRKGQLGFVVATQGPARFFRELTQRAVAAGALHLWILRHDGRAIATEYQVAAPDARYALRAESDSAFADLAPGLCLSFNIIESLFARRSVHHYDMGPADGACRLGLATGRHDAVALEAYAPTTYGRFLHAVETRLIPFARRLARPGGAACA
jgi:CelD/BcsL family acetyltransferase involved in cellulose biosynthesis